MILLVNNVDGKTSLEVKTDKSFESKGTLFVIYISVTTLHSANQKQVFFSCTLLNAIKKKGLDHLYKSMAEKPFYNTPYC